MADIRLVRPRANRVWIGSAALALVAIAVWAWGTFGYDPTLQEERPLIGAELNFGAERAPVLPAFPVPFDSVLPLGTRDLGTYVHLRGNTESAIRRNGVLVRASDGRRILVRLEPAPGDSVTIPFRAGGTVNVVGYLQKVALAEYRVWMDTLGVRIPRPAPGVKFGDLPDPAFARLDSLFVKEYYVSVRPEGLRGPAIAAPGEE